VRRVRLHDLPTVREYTPTPSGPWCKALPQRSAPALDFIDRLRAGEEPLDDHVIGGFRTDQGSIYASVMPKEETTAFHVRTTQGLKLAHGQVSNLRISGYDGLMGGKGKKGRGKVEHRRPDEVEIKNFLMDELTKAKTNCTNKLRDRSISQTERDTYTTRRRLYAQYFHDIANPNVPSNVRRQSDFRKLFEKITNKDWMDVRINLPRIPEIMFKAATQWDLSEPGEPAGLTPRESEALYMLREHNLPVEIVECDTGVQFERLLEIHPTANCASKERINFPDRERQYRLGLDRMLKVAVSEGGSIHREVCAGKELESIEMWSGISVPRLRRAWAMVYGSPRQDYAPTEKDKEDIISLRELSLQDVVLVTGFDFRAVRDCLNAYFEEHPDDPGHIYSDAVPDYLARHILSLSGLKRPEVSEITGASDNQVKYVRLEHRRNPKRWGTEAAEPTPASSASAKRAPTQPRQDGWERWVNVEIRNELEKARDVVSLCEGSRAYAEVYERMFQAALASPFTGGSVRDYLLELEGSLTSWRDFENYYWELKGLPAKLGESGHAGGSSPASSPGMPPRSPASPPEDGGVGWANVIIESSLRRARDVAGLDMRAQAQACVPIYAGMLERMKSRRSRAAAQRIISSNWKATIYPGKSSSISMSN
jgi:hypothetical protein